MTSIISYICHIVLLLADTDSGYVWNLDIGDVVGKRDCNASCDRLTVHLLHRPTNIPHSTFSTTPFRTFLRCS